MLLRLPMMELHQLGVSGSLMQGLEGVMTGEKNAGGMLEWR
jgi:hypothetical protein